ncbi:hypothetical protein [Saccharothrix hoggarensis]|uniref:Serine/threonine protein kinase n=1 Tax=Saccharothrix hoggarensis TaxID=913853 RepID=A0ABW3QF56_9PSEU
MDSLLLLMRVLGAERQCDWEALLDRANAAKRRSAPATRPAVASETVTTPEEKTTPESEVAPDLGRRSRWRSRGVRWWAGGGAAAAVIAALVALFAAGGWRTITGSSESSATVSTSSGDTGVTGAERRGVPCWRTTSTAPAPSSPASSAQPSPRPKAYAPGGAGDAELVLDQRHIVVVDGSADGCAVVLSVRADGSEVGPWANAEGKTGRIKDGAPIPPKIVELPWLDTVRRLEFRACFGEVVDKRPVFRETDCGAWVAVDR